MSRPSLILERTTFVLIQILLVYSAWVRGGTRIAIQWPLPWLALLLFGMLLLACRQRSGGTTDHVSLRRLLMDPVLLFGGLFIALLAAQWWNAGRELILDWDTMGWVYGPPRRPGFPSAIRRADAAEMLRWFVPALALVLGIRHAADPACTGRSTLVVQAFSAGLLGFVGMLQYVFAEVWGLGSTAADGYFAFLSFGYANHAGAYFVLMLSVSLGLLIDSIGFNRSGGYGHSIGLGAMALCCFVGAHVAISRASILLSWFVSGIAGIFLLWKSWKSGSRSGFVDRLIAVAIVASLAFFAIRLGGGALLSSEFETIIEGRSDSAETTNAAVLDRFMRYGFLGDRITQRHIAWQIWRDHPWFGAGGWAQSHMATTMAPEEQWDALTDEGLANTHCDPLQFLSEFGVVGMVLLSGVCVFLLWPLRRVRRRAFADAVPTIGFVGAGVIALYAWVDLPFRSPAVLYMWVVVLAALPCVVAFHHKIRTGGGRACH